MYKGSIFCSMAAFKNHCTFGFWKASLFHELSAIINKDSEEAMGQFGRITSIKDLPGDKIFSNYILKVKKFHDDGSKPVRNPKPEKPKELIVPDYFLKVLKKNKKAIKTFMLFSYSNKKEYVEWITDAKSDDTRSKRMGSAIEWMEEGKDRNWKYRK